MYDSVGVSIESPVTSPRGTPVESEYYYTLVFQNTRAWTDSHGAQAPLTGERITYADALRILRSVTAGGKEREVHAINEFRMAWTAKFRTPHPAGTDMVPRIYFQELLRELIVQRFDAIPDLFLKTSVPADQQLLLISFRPSKALLCATADRLHYKVAIMSEVDPGETFWSADPTRASAEAFQWTKADAQEELYRLFLTGKIPTEEAQIFDGEDAAMWSRRIHALRRFSDPLVTKIVATQDHSQTTYLPFKNRACLQYLYRQIDGNGEDPTPFRVVDKIRLTKAIIDAQFDCDGLVQYRLLQHHLCGHTHQTDGIDTSIDMLRMHWGTLTSAFRLYHQSLTTLPQLLSYQPIVHIRNYFGEEIALYCAYTSFCVTSLQLLCAVAIPVAVLHAASPNSAQLPAHWYYIGFAIVTAAFTQSLVRKWDIQERVLATEWGVMRLQRDDTPRPKFRGHQITSPITHRQELWYSPWRRELQRLASAVLLSGLSFGMLAWDYVMLTSDVYAKAVDQCGLLVVHVAVAMVAKLWTAPLATLSRCLTDWENYKLQHDYDLNLTLKFAVVQSVNLFGVLWLLAFAMPILSADTHSAHTEAAHLLLTYLGIELLVAVWELRPCIIAAIGSSRRAELDTQRLLVPRPVSLALDDQLTLTQYEGVMFDYAQVTITLGFVAWFSPLAPLATVAAWAIVALQIRADAFKLSVCTQRPPPTQRNSIGSWATYLRVLAFGAWVHSAALIVLYLSPASLSLLLAATTSEDDRLASETLALAAFAGCGSVAWLASVHDQQDRSLLKKLWWRALRAQHLEAKYIDNLDRLPDAVRDALPSGRVFLNGVHAYVVTGNQADEDAAEELLDELAQLQRRYAQLETQVAELRAQDAAVGAVHVELGSINILPAMDALTKAVDSFVQLQLTTAAGKKTKPVNTSVVKKNRSPQWTEAFDLALHALDDVLVARVFDWELLGKNRRIGTARLDMADVLATAPPAVAAQASPGRRQSTATPTDQGGLPPPSAPRVRMASFEVAIELPEVLLNSMHADLVKYGHPKLSLRGGVQLEPLGRLLWQQQQLQTKIQQLQDKEKKFFEWKI